MKAPKNPYAVKLSGEEEREITTRLCEEIRAAKRARSLVMNDDGLIDFAYSLYEQQAQKGISRDTPRYGGADLTSPIGTENVDALSARAVQTIFKLEPLWIVEGVGKSAVKAPIVEEFMQWRQESVRFQKVAKRAITSSLVETGAILEVCEDADQVVRHAIVKAKVARAEDGTILLDGKTGYPMPELDADGVPVPSEDGEVACVEVKRTWTDYKRRGASVRRRSMKDFAFLPSHAEDEREVWGHATRFWQRLDEIQWREEAGEYRHVEALGGDTQERQQTPDMDRASVSLETVPGYDNAEKELWRVQFWADLKGDGQTFYTAVVSEQHDVVLSLECDWLQRYRTVYLNPYPAPYSVYGYSLILTKLLTTIEEHTAWRNMNADRGTLKSNAPLKVRRNSSWDPTLQPFAAGAVIVLDNMDDVQPFAFDDITAQAMGKESQCPVDAQRIIGMNDIALGQTTAQSRTLGENRMATTQSFVRTDDPISNIQEALEEVGELFHAIEVQALKEQENGIDAPAPVSEQIQLKGDPSFDGTFTYRMLEGEYRFKPRGSSDQADPNRRQQVFVNGLNVLAGWAKMSPAIAQRMQTPEFADALMQMWVTEFKPRDKQAFLKPMQPPQPAPMAGAVQQGPQSGPPGAPSFGGDELIQQMLQQVPQGAVN